MTQLAGNAHWAKPSPLFAHRARPTLLKCKNEYLVLALRKETAVQTVVVLAFSRLEKPRCREMSAGSYALHSVPPNLFANLKFFSSTLNLRLVVPPSAARYVMVKS